MPRKPLESNPFTLVYSRLIDMAKENGNLMRLVKSRNLIDLSDDDAKRNISHADLPEIMLLQAGMITNLQATSNSSEVSRTYEWVVNTQHTLINESFNQILWELFRSMSIWCEEKGLTSLKWKEKNFVKRLIVPESSETMVETEESRGLEGWSSLVMVEVQMYFTTADLRSL